jgi:tRNA-dihydrouridine synthase B
VRVARKHISWYTKGLIGSSAFRHTMNRLDSVTEQLTVVDEYFAQAARADSRLRYENSHDNNNAQDMPPASRLAA